MLLLARVNVLAKVECPTGYNDGRPITILPTLYRLWSSVVCHQLLRAWADCMPVGIMGGLPGRAARDVTYAMQHAIECSHLEDTALSGFVLDIVKCYNALPRQPVRQLLHHLGCPEAVVDCWIEGLGRVQRAASFAGSVSAPQSSSTGAPEGDPLSVPAAIAVSWLLYVALQEFDVPAEFFVDNWAWHTDHHESHIAAMQETLAVTHALKLTIDWRKSFAWSRDVAGYQWWQQYGSSLLPAEAPFHLLAHAKDLGTAMTYRGSRSLGCIHTRLAEGHARMRRLKHQPLPTSVKARIIQTAIWPAIFYGTEGHAIGLRKLADLRTAASKALTGGQQRANPYLATSLLAACLQDPEMFLLSCMLRALARTLRRNPALGWSIVRLAACADGSPYKVCGPSSALAAVLRRSEWSLSSSAVLKGPGNFALNLATCSGKDIRDTLALTWSFQLRSRIGHRNGLHQVDVPDPSTTISVLRTFTSSEQKVLGRHISGCFQTAATKVLWQASESSACPWCGQVEDRPHRFLHCPAFQAVRALHPDAIQAMTVDFPHWTYAPFAVLPDAVDITTLLFSSRPHPSMPHEEAARVQREGHSALRFYTDGACRHPTLPLARHAAWAVCFDASTSSADRQLNVDAWSSTGCLPPAFQPRAMGVVSGRQTVARAELTAAIQAIRIGALANRTPVHIVTDSAYVIHILSRFAAGLELRLLDSSPNLDLLHLFREVWFSGVTFSKIKAHQDPAAAGTADLRWERLGNASADRASALALQHDLPIVEELVDDIAAKQQSQAVKLRATFQYLLALNAATQALLVQEGRSSLPTASDSCNRDPSVGVERPLEESWRIWIRCRSATCAATPLMDPPDITFLVNSWGPDFSWRVWRWAQTLQWLQDGASSMEGITTLELFCDFVCQTVRNMCCSLLQRLDCSQGPCGFGCTLCPLAFDNWRIRPIVDWWVEPPLDEYPPWWGSGIASPDQAMRPAACCRLREIPRFSFVHFCSSARQRSSGNILTLTDRRHGPFPVPLLLPRLL